MSHYVLLKSSFVSFSQVTMEAGGLPLELWRMILAYLHLPDLGRCSLVCKAWYELTLSLDSTRWRQLCLGCTECRHPNWPNQPDVEPESWREAFKQHYLASKTWTKNALDLESSVCFSLFRRKRERRTLSVGPGHEFDSLGSALAMASLYDRIVLFPGVYEEQGEIILKVPVEIVGHGKLGEVVLLASIDQHCSTTRLCNLIFMPAWFSPIMYKVGVHIREMLCEPDPRGLASSQRASMFARIPPIPMYILLRRNQLRNQLRNDQCHSKFCFIFVTALLENEVWTCSKDYLHPCTSALPT